MTLSDLSQLVSLVLCAAVLFAALCVVLNCLETWARTSPGPRDAGPPAPDLALLESRDAIRLRGVLRRGDPADLADELACLDESLTDLRALAADVGEARAQAIRDYCQRLERRRADLVQALDRARHNGRARS